MNLHSARRFSFTLPLSVLLFAGSARSQVPAGWWISSHHRTPTNMTAAGLWLHHPTGASPSIPVAGLDGDLLGTGAGATLAGQFAGAASVTLCEATGTIVYVGEMRTGTTNYLDLHRITLAGTTAIASEVVGTIPNYPGITDTTVTRISSLAPLYVSESPASEPYILMTLAGLPGPGVPQLAVYQRLTGLSIVPPL